ncbi:MAG: 3-oxoacyl-[acyl-carrier-protein] synthase III C-terminal domain-containing protein [Acidobacteriota bacterium]|nr:3-oxoacyl-[acyl-carrier-protein] synthase III C-terminal domain-containing protein [Acidobacteriota bacterium]
MMTVGIHAFGGYVPPRRLQRAVVVNANAWFAPALKSLARGERAIANWDEDAVTMAVEAVRDAFAEAPRDALAGLFLASTTLPFADRQNAGVVVEALQLGRQIRTLDVAGSQRAGSSALVTALQTAAGGGGPVLVVAAEKRAARAASVLELTAGDGAAAVLVARGEGVARLLGVATESVDFVDHYREQPQRFDYGWEERWVRDEGYLEIAPVAIRRALQTAGVEPENVNHFCFPVATRRVADTLARKVGLRDESVRDNLQQGCGEAGAAHPLLLLVHALEHAAPGDIVVATGFGQGCDAIVVEVTGSLRRTRPARGVTGHLACGRADSNYQRYLAINDLLTIERGLRAEVDKQTGLTTLYRNKEMLLGMVGGRCRACGTPQYPKSGVCVNPDCHAVDSQDDHPFSEQGGRLNSFTADRLTYCPDPPAYYGMVQFDQGGRAMMDLADVDPERELVVGQRMRMVFRVKDYDRVRGFRRYFWKAKPD